jgi:hypothetical protein
MGLYSLLDHQAKSILETLSIKCLYYSSEYFRKQYCSLSSKTKLLIMSLEILQLLLYQIIFLWFPNTIKDSCLILRNLHQLILEIINISMLAIFLCV